MNRNIWDLKLGERITLDSGEVVQVMAPTEDGEWILIKYVEAPDAPELVGTEDLCSTGEIASLVS